MLLMTDFSPPRLSKAQHRIMALLIAHGELSGADIRKLSGIKRGTVYTTLVRMQDKGFVESRQGDTPSWGGPPRRNFLPTGYGAKIYQAYEQLVSLAGFRLAFGGAQ